MRHALVPLLALIAAPALAQSSGASLLPNGQPAVMSVPDGRLSAEASAQFTKFDKEAKGYLDRLEFAQWLSTLDGSEPAGVRRTLHAKASDQPAVRILNATSASFAKADTAANGQISPEEAAIFLAGPNN